jgi:16S rRNA (guanine966-N2)-methyltransferase
MKLRIVGGRLGRRVLTIPRAGEQFRPTLEKNRASLAEIVKDIVSGAAVADLCAGSGAMGFELLSRGAKTVHFVENDRTRAKLITEHCTLFGVTISCRVFCDDIRRFIDGFPCTYDIIFFDPPYEDPVLPEVVPLLADGLAKGGLLMYERRKKSPGAVLPSTCPLKLTRTRIFGDTAVDFYNRSS